MTTSSVTVPDCLVNDSFEATVHADGTSSFGFRFTQKEELTLS